MLVPTTFCIGKVALFMWRIRIGNAPFPFVAYVNGLHQRGQIYNPNIKVLKILAIFYLNVLVMQFTEQPWQLRILKFFKEINRKYIYMGTDISIILIIILLSTIKYIKNTQRFPYFPIPLSPFDKCFVYFMHTIIVYIFL